MNRHRPLFHARLAIPLIVAGLVGCHDPHTIDVDLSAAQPRFIIHHPTWGWPVRWPRVSDLVIADKDDSLWEIKTTDPSGAAARHLAIVYGHLPPDFVQVYPLNNAPPKTLKPGQVYYVGATGPDSVFRVIFALPIRANSVNPGAGRQSNTRPISPNLPE